MLVIIVIFGKTANLLSGFICCVSSAAACADGLFGLNCEWTCQCEDSSEPCGKVSGACLSGCRHGYTGKDCLTGKPVEIIIKQCALCRPRPTFNLQMAKSFCEFKNLQYIGYIVELDIKNLY